LRVERQWTPYAVRTEPGRNGATTRYGMADPKHGSKRTLPISESLVHAINLHVAKYGTSTEGTIASLEHSGRPVTQQQWHDVWTAAAERAGVSARWSAHDLRHAFGSLHYNAGTPAPTVAAWMGHSLATFLAIYAHHDERHGTPLVDPLAGLAEAEEEADTTDGGAETGSKVARELHGRKAKGA
jgi:integrase